MEPNFRCDCPITSALDLLGDRWILVIIKQMLLEGKQTFKDFSESDEAIATNILAARLKTLEEWQIITKEKLPTNKKSNLYRLTERGLSLTPIIVELALWSDASLRELHPEIRSDEGLIQMKQDKVAFTKTIQDGYRERIGLR